MVDIDPLNEMIRKVLRSAVERHHTETDSAVAYGLLTDWDDAVERFTKVMPKDFKRVLQAREAAEFAATAATRTWRSWRRRMADPKGFLTTARESR